MIKAILFDYGGTLDTAARHWYYVIREAYQNAGCINIPDSDLRDAYVYGERTLGKNPIIQPQDDFKALLLKKTSLQLHYLIEQQTLHIEADSDMEVMCERIASYCDEYARKCITSVIPVLDNLSQRFPLVLVTNFYGNIKSVLQSYHIEHYFHTIIESAVVGVRKPDPQIWQLGVDAVGVQSHEVLAVGDSYGKDIVPAHTVGCKTAWYKGEEWEKKTYDEALPDYIIGSIKDLCSICL